jgi:hypothetical protein
MGWTPWSVMQNWTAKTSGIGSCLDTITSGLDIGARTHINEVIIVSEFNEINSYDFRMKTMSSLPPIVNRRVPVLFTLFVFVLDIMFQHILCCVFCFVCLRLVSSVPNFDKFLWIVRSWLHLGILKRVLTTAPLVPHHYVLPCRCIIPPIIVTLSLFVTPPHLYRL